MPFYFAEIKNIQGDSIVLDGAEHKHLSAVMRTRLGESVTVTDGAGLTYECVVVEQTKSKTELSVVTISRNRGESIRRVTMAVGLSAAGKFDLILQMCTEIGVAAFVPLLTEKSKIKLESADRAEKKLSRWREVLKAAIKQCERSVLPEISAPQTLKDYLRKLKTSKSPVIFAHPHALPSSRTSAPELLFGDHNLTLVVGPESGFTPDEADLAMQVGCLPLRLEDRILRAETAAVALAALALAGNTSRGC